MSDQQNPDPLPEFTRLVDLASRALGGGVIAANDELFAERENLITPAEPHYNPHSFGHKGQIYDGWETRRRREPGYDWAIVRLGVPGVVRGVVVDTAFFTGNYPPQVSVQGVMVDGYPSPSELADLPANGGGHTREKGWFDLVGRSDAGGNRKNPYPVTGPDRLVTHIRLCMHPDGGVARLRVYGEPVVDPRHLVAGSLDLAALENGGEVVACSNMFYSSPRNLISPGQARTMGDGWETARRRDDGNDYVEVRLAGPGRVRLVELDTSHFVGNAPGWAGLSGRDARAGGGWTPLVARERLQPDTRHRFQVPQGAEVTHARLDVFPDGGMARVRLWGELSDSGHAALVSRWAELGGAS